MCNATPDLTEVPAMTIVNTAPSPATAVPAAPPPANALPPAPPAHALQPHERLQLARDALAGQPISELARDHDVSRKFVYQQLDKAEQGLAAAFPPDPAKDGAVLFYLPVTAAWLHRLILGLLLICHSSYRGVYELLRDLFHC